jgi:hypothetical protein
MLVYLGGIADDEGFENVADEFFRLAFQEVSGWSFAEERYADILMKRGDLEGARIQYERASSEGGGFVLSMKLGGLLHRLGDEPASAEQFRKALALYDDRPFPPGVGAGVLNSMEAAVRREGGGEGLETVQKLRERLLKPEE